MKLTSDFDFDLCGYDLSSNDLAFLISEKYPNLVHGVHFWCMHYVKENSAERLSPSVIVDWKPEDIPEPSFEDIQQLESSSVGLADYRIWQSRLEIFTPISSRQLWLAARQIGIYESDVLAKINLLDDDIPAEKEKKEILLIELSKPPLAGFLRDSPAMEEVREMMGITSAEFDSIWIWAAQIE